MLLTFISSHRDAIAAVITVINIIAFFVCACDKRAAITKRSRVPEKVLLGFSFFFGSAGMLVAMFVFRHKTKKAKFTVTVPLCLVLHTFLLYAVGIIHI